MNTNKSVKSNRLELIWILAQSDFHIRYYGSFLGLLWALINPLAKLAIYYVVFTFILLRGRENFAVYLFCGLIIWGLFAEGTNTSLQLLRNKRYLIESVNLKKLDVYVSSMISSLLGFMFNFSILILFCVLLGTDISIWALIFPVIFLTVVLFTMAVSMFLSTLFIFIKDLKHVWDIVIMAGFWSLPIIWEQELVYTKATILQYIHPLTGVLINTRNVFMFGLKPDMFLLLYGLGYSIIAFVLAFLFMNKFSHKAIENG